MAKAASRDKQGRVKSETVGSSDYVSMCMQMEKIPAFAYKIPAFAYICKCRDPGSRPRADCQWQFEVKYVAVRTRNMPIATVCQCGSATGPTGLLKPKVVLELHFFRHLYYTPL